MVVGKSGRKKGKIFADDHAYRRAKDWADSNKVGTYKHGDSACFHLNYQVSVYMDPKRRVVLDITLEIRGNRH